TWHPLPPARDGASSEPRRVAESLDQVARRLGAPATAVLSAVFAHWDEAVGPTVAAHCRPHTLLDGVLIVEVDEPGWATQLRYLATDVVRRLDQVAGDGVVVRLEVRVRRS